MTKVDLRKECDRINPFLALIDFEASVDGNLIQLTDLTGANWGDIESERFETAADVVVRLDIYWDDYFVSDEYDGPEWKTYEDVRDWYRENGMDSMADEINGFIEFYNSVTLSVDIALKS